MGNEITSWGAKLHHGERNYIMGSEIERKYIMEERNYIMGSEIERKYIMEERNYIMGSEIASWGSWRSEIERKYIITDWYIWGKHV